MITNRKVLSDPRMRGEYKKFLSQPVTGKTNAVGQVRNPTQQLTNGFKGIQNQGRPRPAPSAGQVQQNYYRNRSTEQGGTQQPAMAATPPSTLPMRKNRYAGV